MYNLSSLKHTKIDKGALGHAFRLSFVYFNDFDAIFLADDFDFTQEFITRFKNICSYDFVFIFVVICQKICAIITKPKNRSSSLNSDFFLPNGALHQKVELGTNILASRGPRRTGSFSLTSPSMVMILIAADSRQTQPELLTASGDGNG